MNHCSTIEQRVDIISQMLAQPRHGLVSQLSRTYQVSRQTLYRWAASGRKALHEAMGAPLVPLKQKTSLATLVLTLLIENHARYRGIQSTLKRLHGIRISIGSICTIIQDAGQRAQAWMNRQRAQAPRTLALDEQYSSQRGKAYLNVIDVHSGQVWASIPPVAVDGESWTLVLWSLSEQGIEPVHTVSDGGRAIADALSHLELDQTHQRDVWHLFHVAAQVQGRLERAVKAEQDRLPALQRQAERVAAGKRVQGRPSGRTLHQQHIVLAQMQSVADAVRYLCEQLHALLDVVVLHDGAIMSSSFREQELQTIVALLDEVAMLAQPGLQQHLAMLSKQLRLALPHALLFARLLDGSQEQALSRLGSQAVALLAWAWQRRSVLGPSSQDLLRDLPSLWQAQASLLFTAWDRAVRASSAVENWHSIVRPHLAVHRTLSAGMLALLAVWQNHRIAPRGLHEGLSPLQRTGSTEDQPDWLAALGYPVLVV
ncbi:hypothetical protein [Tengunoibacter tsumagoiensis]|uniref:Transposase n=1 Tax=Tengunoibacter tsumagoiensis TaxID=2014871 RepID=A0A402A873_9CHLR|nr:hypothetical protein [Tengunoibacter tsumagoiensis]GCE15354.1 hypothetical protein KTT_52130 [Tengunoibacter tsumagoiensis]